MILWQKHTNFPPVIGEFRRKETKQVKSARWGDEVSEETDGVFLEAAEDGGEDG